MIKNFENKLTEFGIELPEISAPFANYSPFVQTGNLLFVSGQLPIGKSGIIRGKLGQTLKTEEGVAAANLCAQALLAQVQRAIDGKWKRFIRVVKLTAFVNSTDDFVDQAIVANGASVLLVKLLGNSGEHVRSAVSVNALPMGAAVEIEGIFEIDDSSAIYIDNLFMP